MRIAPILAVLALTTTAAAGCSSSASKPSAQPLAPATGTSAPAAAASSPAPAKASVGTVQEVRTADGGKLQVTVVKVVDPATSSTEGLRPADGERWVAVQLKIANTGAKAVTDNLYGFRIADAQGQAVNIQADAETTAGPMLDVLQGLNLAPGDATLGFITLHLPMAAKLARIQYSPQGGTTAQWTLG